MKLLPSEKSLFLAVCSTHHPRESPELLNKLRNNSLAEADLERSFPEEWKEFEQNVRKTFLDKRNHAIEWALKHHRCAKPARVARLLSFRAERSRTHQELKAMISTSEGLGEALMFPLLTVVRPQSDVLLHDNTVCYALSPQELEWARERKLIGSAESMGK